MVEARRHGAVIARGDDTVAVKGNHYFPGDSVSTTRLRPSGTTTTCPGKGTAHCYSLLADGTGNVDAARYYPDLEPEAESIRGRIAFRKGVTVG